MGDPPSERVLDQRLHNRVIESLEALAGGDHAVRTLGNAEYVNQFFDWIDDDAQSWNWRAYSTWTPTEIALVERVQAELRLACDETPRICTDDEFIASGWPQRIASAAAEALAVLLPRGRFSEELEEGSPSLPA